MYSIFSRSSRWNGETGVAFSDFLDQAEAGTVTEVTFQGSYLHYRTMHGYRLKTYTPFDPDLIKLLRAKHVTIKAEPEESDPWWAFLLVNFFPMGAILAVWIWYNEKRLERAER